MIQDHSFLIESHFSENTLPVSITGPIRGTFEYGPHVDATTMGHCHGHYTVVHLDGDDELIGVHPEIAWYIFQTHPLEYEKYLKPVYDEVHSIHREFGHEKLEEDRRFVRLVQRTLPNIGLPYFINHGNIEPRHARAILALVVHRGNNLIRNNQQSTAR